MFTIAFKELRLFLKDKRALLLTFITPIGLITLLTFAFGGNSKEKKFDPIKILICDLDKTSSSKKFISDLEKVKQLKIEDAAFEEGKEFVKKGKRLALLVIEKDFEHKTDEGKSPVTLYYDAAREPEFGILQSVLMGEIMTGIGQKGIKSIVMRKIKEQFGDMDSSTMAFIDKGMIGMFSGGGKSSPTDDLVKIEALKGETESSPALIHAVAGTAVMTLLFAVAGFGASLLEEKEKGTLKRLLLTPVDPLHILFGKMICGIFISVLQLMLMFLFAYIAFGLEIMSVLPALFIMIFATAFACACFGMFIASICSTRRQAEGMSTAVVLIMSAIGGSMIPSFIMPEFMQKMSMFTVNYWSIQGMYDIFWRDLPMAEWLLNVYVLFGIGILFIAISVPMYRKNVLKI